MYSIEQYIQLSEFAKTYNYGSIKDELYSYFEYIYDKDIMDYIGFKLQVCVKQSKPMYLHGYVLSSALHHYLSHTENDSLTILETGTARGFSSIIMGSVLQHFDKNGTIYTIDHVNRFDNCYKSAELGREISFRECVEEWGDIVDRYIRPLNGNSYNILKDYDTKLERIHFAFLDGSHFYNDLTFELQYVENKQKAGDIIVCDDYTHSQFPEICKAIDEFLTKNKYVHRIFYANDGTKTRGYVFMKRL